MGWGEPPPCGSLVQNLTPETCQIEDIIQERDKMFRMIYKDWLQGPNMLSNVWPAGHNSLHLHHIKFKTS